MAFEILMGMIEGLTSQEDMKKVQLAIREASDWNHKINRALKFEQINNYLSLGLAQDPFLDEVDMETVTYKKKGGKLVATAKKRTLEMMRVEHDAKNAPDYVQAAMSFIALEFDWIATMMIVDYDKTGEIYQEVPEHLYAELKAAKDRINKPEFEMVKQRKFYKGKPAHVFEFIVNGVDVMEDSRAFVNSLAHGKEYAAKNMGNASKDTWRKCGKILAKISFLKPKEVADFTKKKKAEGDESSSDEYSEEEAAASPK